MELIIYLIGGLLAAVAAYLFLTHLVGLTWLKASVGLTSLVVMALVTPGAIAAVRAGQVLANPANSNAEAIDRARETLRRDILRRTNLYRTYPAETILAVRIANRFA